jgi:hypothetical protein
MLTLISLDAFISVYITAQSRTTSGQSGKAVAAPPQNLEFSLVTRVDLFFPTRLWRGNCKYSQAFMGTPGVSAFGDIS